jgi:hypothetical protein
MTAENNLGHVDIRVTHVVPHDPECMVRKLRKFLDCGLSGVRTPAKADC